MKVLHCLVMAASLCAAIAQAQGNHAQSSAAAENAVVSPGESPGHGVRRVNHRQADKNDERVAPVSFCNNIHFGS